MKFFDYWYWRGYFSIMSKLNHLYNREKILYVVKCIRNGGIRYWKPVRVYSGLWRIQLFISFYYRAPWPILSPATVQSVYLLFELFWAKLERRAKSMFVKLRDRTKRDVGTSKANKASDFSCWPWLVARPVWPDLAKLRQFWKNERLWYSFRVYLVFDKILSLLWHIFVMLCKFALL